MTLKVIGAGLPRTGTTSLKDALEQLLDGRCYHMLELMENLDAGAQWWQALDGDLDQLDVALAGYVAAIDWPASVFWRELTERHPDATVVLSHRADPATWWASVDKTVWASMRQPDMEPQFAAFSAKMRSKSGLGDDWDDPEAAMAMYQKHFDEVAAAVPADKLVIWQAADGWAPLCERLGIAEPSDPFPHLNTSAEFRARAGFDA